MNKDQHRLYDIIYTLNLRTGKQVKNHPRHKDSATYQIRNAVIYKLLAAPNAGDFRIKQSVVFDTMFSSAYFGSLVGYHT